MAADKISKELSSGSRSGQFGDNQKQPGNDQKDYWDKSWIYSYDPETQTQSSQWKTLEKQRPRKRARGAPSRQCSLCFFY